MDRSGVEALLKNTSILADAVNGTWNELFALIQSIQENTLELSDLIESHDKLAQFDSQDPIETLLENFFNTKCEVFLEVYSKHLRSPDFWMFEKEMKIAARLYNKKAIIQAKRDGALLEEIVPLNIGADETPDVVILNESHFPYYAHYSQCKIVSQILAPVSESMDVEPAFNEWEIF